MDRDFTADELFEIHVLDLIDELAEISWSVQESVRDLKRHHRRLKAGHAGILQTNW